MSSYSKFWSGNVMGDKTGSFTFELTNPDKQKHEGILSFYGQ